MFLEYKLVLLIPRSVHGCRVFLTWQNDTSNYEMNGNTLFKHGKIHSGTE